MRAVRFAEFGGPDVLRLVEVPEPHPGPEQVRVVVRACGINPADWKIREGELGGALPQGIGIEVAGVVDEVGALVTDVAVGDPVFGPTADSINAGDVVIGPTTGGASDYALLNDYVRIPEAMGFAQAAALPVAVETATRGVDELGVKAGDTVLINGGAGAVGTVATQLAIARGARVIATASEGNFERLRGYGAEPTTYGEGLPARVARLAPDGVDLVLDLGPGGALPVLVEIAGDPARVLTISDFQNADAHLVPASGRGGTTRRWDALASAARLAAEGKLNVPIQQTFGLEQFGEAQRMSQAGHLRGKLVLVLD